jgi:hypothetical protein
VRARTDNFYQKKEAVMFDSKKIINYIEDKHLADGGYFFAKVEPSSLLDTYYAVKTLYLLNQKITYKNSIINYLLNFEGNGYIDDLRGLFLFLEILKTFQWDIAPYRKYKKILEEASQDSYLFNPQRTIDIESTSELEELFFLISLSKDLNYRLDRQRIVFFISLFQNRDGGFGAKGISSNATTYYAVKSLALLESLKHISPIILFLREKEKNMTDYFLEDVYYISMSLFFTAGNLVNKNKVIDFLALCQRDNGGFSRSKNLGISTIQDTFFAVSLIKYLT